MLREPQVSALTARIERCVEGKAIFHHDRKKD
jgi:hypothetical protein